MGMSQGPADPRDRRQRPAEPRCLVLREGDAYWGRQDLEYFTGVAAETAGSRALCLHVLRIPPGGRAQAHYHRDHETAIYMLEGDSDFWWGEALEHHEHVRQGEFVYIPPCVPHLPVNFSDRTVAALIARTDPNEQESVVPTPDLDGLPHTAEPPRTR
jgi:uncharacterized RmlC-like cupin family protein